MNRTIRNLIITAPLAALAFTLSTGAAMAETPPNEPGPVIVLAPADPDPKPMDIAIPDPVEPKNPQDKAPVPPKQDDPPQDKAPAPNDPKDPIDPELPLDNGDNDGTDPDVPGEGEPDQGCFEGCDLPEEKVVAPTAEKAADVVLPTQVHAGLPGAHTDQQHDESFNLAWLLVGGLVVTASGAAYAARSRSRHQA